MIVVLAMVVTVLVLIFLGLTLYYRRRKKIDLLLRKGGRQGNLLYESSIF